MDIPSLPSRTPVIEMLPLSEGNPGARDTPTVLATEDRNVSDWGSHTAQTRQKFLARGSHMTRTRDKTHCFFKQLTCSAVPTIKKNTHKTAEKFLHLSSHIETKHDIHFFTESKDTAHKTKKKCVYCKRTQHHTHVTRQTSLILQNPIGQNQHHNNNKKKLKSDQDSVGQQQKCSLLPDI